MNKPQGYRAARVAGVAAAALALAACGGGGGDGNGSGAGSGGNTGGGSLSDATRLQAASATAQSSSNACAPLRPFYWEIGDATSVRGSGSVANTGSLVTIQRATAMPIASASKWLYGAYVAEKRGGVLNADDVQALTFRSGYTDFSACTRTDTVASCATAGTNAVLHPENVGRFYYGGGHMQHHASGFGAIAGMDNTALASEISTTLGLGAPFAYSQPQLAGGADTNAAVYAGFLQRVLRGELRIAALLGTSATCTNPGTCATAVYSPAAGNDWNYSIGHWVEADPATGDGSFSSAGAFGFYPWIDASKQWYGVLARVDLASSGAGVESARCGALIRKAWFTGIAQ